MRLLVLSNVSGSVDRVVDLVKSHNVIAKEANLSGNALVQNVAAALSGGTYDEVILVARDPIGASMLLNKQDGIDAAVCGSIDDVHLAKDNGANVIVIRDVHSNELQEIVAEAVGSGGIFKGLKGGVKMPAILPKKEEHPESREEKRERERQVAKPAKRAVEEEPGETARTSGKRDVVSKIKDYLGIV